MAWDRMLRDSGFSNERIANIILTKFIIGDTKSSINFSLDGSYLGDGGVIEYMSINAYNILYNYNKKLIVDNKVKNGKLSGKLNNLKLRVEHIIPSACAFNYLNDLFKVGKLMDIKPILEIFPYLKLAVITHEEDTRLNAAKLRQKMPDGWIWDLNNMDMFARYNAVNIELINQRKKYY